jgi:hypothetical protein
MTAGVLGIAPESLGRWERRREDEPPPPRPAPGSCIPPEARWRIRQEYQAHYGEWGPTILAPWVKREGIGSWCADTIAHIIADLREEPEKAPSPLRYEVTAPMAVWAEDGAGFRERGQKRELLVLQDEHSRYKVIHRLVGGPATGEDVCDYLEQAFEEHGAPLVLKHDGGAIFHTEGVRNLLRRWGVIELTGPRYYPQYNGKKERSIRDIKSYERAMRRHGVQGSLADRLEATLHDLNNVRPRPMLKGRTAREVFHQDGGLLPDRDAFARAVDQREARLRLEAATRQDLDDARRRAVEQLLLDYGLLEYRGNKLPYFAAGTRT